MGVIFPSYISQIDSMCWNGEKTSGGRPGKACRRRGNGRGAVLQLDLDALLRSLHDVDVVGRQCGFRPASVRGEGFHFASAFVVDADEASGRGLVDDEAAFLCVDFCPVCGDAAHAVGIILLESHVQEGIAVEFRCGEAVLRVQHIGVVRSVEGDGVDTPSVVGRDADVARLAVFGLHFHIPAFRLLHREGDGDWTKGKCIGIGIEP